MLMSRCSYHCVTETEVTRGLSVSVRMTMESRSRATAAVCASEMKIDVDIKKIDAVSKALSEIEELWYIVHATGSSYIYAEFNAKSIDDLNNVITHRINKIDGLLKTETNLVLKFIKRRYDWKTAME